MTDAPVTMDLHPQPGAGQAKPWAFPAPERGALASGLTVLRCHRPGQQVVAVEISLDIPLDAEPDGLDGIAAIMAARCPRARPRTAPRSSPRSWSAAARRSVPSADYLGARVSLEVPASPGCRGRWGCSPRRCARPRSPASEVERLVRNRLDGIPLELANPGRRAAKQLAQELFPASARLSRPRRGTEETVARIDAAGCARSTRPRCGLRPRPRWSWAT